MFFPDKIKSISPTDRVLEIGPGGNPHPRADVLLELKIEDTEEALAQRAFQPELQTDKKVVYYDGGSFPFHDREFDYVICSHVLEHVPDVELFLNEIFRVAPKGYLAYPTIYYDYIYKINEHINVLFKEGNTLFWMKQKDTGLDNFNKIRSFYHKATFNNYWAEGYQNLWFHGFEWDKPFQITRVDSWEKLTYDDKTLNEILPVKEKIVPPDYKVYYKNEAKGIKLFLRKVICKLGLYLK